MLRTILPGGWLSLFLALAFACSAAAQPSDTPSAARIDGTEAGWKSLTLEDFVNVNCPEDTWRMEGSLLRCRGNCVGVIRSRDAYRNHEIVLEWRHLQQGGNSGIFVWSPLESLDALQPNQLPHGIECQILDHGYTAEYESATGKKADWFTTHGDVFPVGGSTMKPFPPVSPNGVRSFPSAEHTRGHREWNHYYIRAIQGEVRLWINGHEVSGGNECRPAEGYLALEAEGAPIDFRNLRVRILP